jgi:cytochrome c oxidase assembly protein Cox11
MKKVFSSALMIGFLSISASMMSKDRDFSLSFEKNNAETVSFEVANAKNVSVIIYNDTYGELVSENLNSDKSITKSYSFKDVDSGVYYLLIESNQKIEKYKIKVGDDKRIVFDKKPVSEIMKPEFSVNENIVKLSLSGLKNKVKISVSDFSDNVYYSSTKSATDGKLEVTFDLNPQTADNYIISVQENGKVFNKVISLR